MLVKIQRCLFSRHKYLKILDLQENCTQGDIKKAYVKMVKKFHPDVHDQSSTKFQEIQKAYDFLKDEQKGPRERE